MRDRLLNAPTWVVCLVAGLGFAVTNVITRLLFLGDPWTEAVVVGGLTGVAFGAVMGPVLVRQQRRARDAAGTASGAALRRATRTAHRGAVPDDPELREAARRLALHQRGELLRQRRWGLPVFLALVALAAWVALGGDAVYWWFAAGFLILATWAYAFLPRRLARRAALLAAPDGAGR